MTRNWICLAPWQATTTRPMGTRMCGMTMLNVRSPEYLLNEFNHILKAVIQSSYETP